jgi:glycosyltransferase involved in cell wall biosynthesis
VNLSSTSQTAEERHEGPPTSVPTRPQRILLLIDNLNIGGAQRLVEIQARAMVGGPHPLRIVNLAGPSALSEALRAAGIDVVDIGLDHLRDFRSLRMVVKAIRDWRPDIIHAHLLHATLIAAILAQLSRARLVITLHNVLPDEGGLLCMAKVGLEEMVLRYVADRIISCGPQVACARGGKLDAKRTIVVRNCVHAPLPLSTEERLAARSEFGFSPDDFLIIAVGRLSRQKGFDILMEAFLQAAGSLQTARLLIVGDGEDRTALANRIKCSAKGDRIVLSGPRSDADRLLGAADLFVLSSRWEGLPLAVLEAMAAGLPVIATNVGDVASATGPDGAILVPPEDVSALTAAICGIAANRDRQSALAKAARKAVVHFTDIPAYLDQLLRVYGDVAPLRL